MSVTSLKTMANMLCLTVQNKITQRTNLDNHQMDTLYATLVKKVLLTVNVWCNGRSLWTGKRDGTNKK